MNFALQKISAWIMIIPLLAVNLILAIVVFYFVAPLISPKVDNSKAQQITQKIISTTTADAVVYWSVNLESNSRKALSYVVKDQVDHPGFTRFVEIGQVMKFTAAVNPTIVQKLLSGSFFCYEISSTGVIHSAVVAGFLSNYPNAWACVFPIKSNTGILNSYVLVIWKQLLSSEEQLQVVSQINPLLN